MDILREGELDRFVTVGRFCDDFEVGLRVEHHAQPSQDYRVVVGYEDAGLQRSGHV